MKPWRPSSLLLLAALASACSSGGAGDDVPPLPEQTADSANALMKEAEKAAGNAAQRVETERRSARSAGETVNKETP